MLERIRSIRCKKRSRSMSEEADYILFENIPLLYNRTNIDLDVAISGFIEKLKSDGTISRKIIADFDKYISTMESFYKTTLGVSDIEYSDTESESSSEKNSPPTARDIYYDLRFLHGAPLERYLNSMETKIRKLFSVDDPDYWLASNVSKKCCLREFIIISELEESDVADFIIPAKIPAVLVDN